MKIKDLIDEAESLPVEDRALVVDSLLRSLKEPLIHVHARARVAFACAQGAVTAVQSFCTREPQRRAHAKAAEPLRGWHPRFPDPALRPLPVEPLPAAHRAWSRKTWGTNASVYMDQWFLNPPDAGVDRKWAEVSRKRLEEIRSGTVAAIPGEQVFEKIWHRFER